MKKEDIIVGFVGSVVAIIIVNTWRQQREATKIRDGIQNLFNKNKPINQQKEEA